MANGDVHEGRQPTGSLGGIEVEITPPGSSGVALRGELALIRLELHNNSESCHEVVLRVTLTPHQPDRSEQRYEYRMVVDGHGQEFKDLELLTDELGYWRVIAEASVDGEVAARAVSAVAIVEKPRNYGKDDPDSFFGAMFIQDYEAAQRIGIKIDRPQAYWRFLSRRDHHDSIDALDRAVGEARKHGLGVILTVRPEMPSNQKPSWAKWDSDKELADEPHIESYRQYVRSLVERYRGQLMAIEFLNEPDLMWFQFPGWDIEEAARVVATLNREGYKVVKEAAPDLPVLGLDMSGVDMLCGLPFTKAVLDEGAEGQFDFYAGHPYTSARYVNEERREHWPEDYDLRGVVIQAQDLMEQYGLSRRYWNTEIGWAWQDGSDPLSDVMRRHAAITARALIEMRSVPDMEKIIWFDFSYRRSERGHNYSLVLDYPNLAASTYSTTAYMLHHVKPAGAVDILPEIRAWRFDSVENDETIVALWDDRPGVALHTEGVDSLRVYDMFGRIIASGNDVRVALSKEPLYYLVPLADGDRLVERLQTSQAEAGEPILINSARMVDSTTLRVALENRLRDEIDLAVELDGKSRDIVLTPGVSYHELRIDPPVAPGVPRRLRVGVEGSGYQLDREVETQLLPLGRVSQVSIDSKLTETLQLNEIRLADRSHVMPPDPTVAWHGRDDLSASIWLGWSEKGLYFAARVSDDIHHTVEDMGSRFWLYDSVMITIDPNDGPARGRGSDSLRIGAVLAPDGPKCFLRGAGRATFSPDIKLEIVREESCTVYEMLIPWTELEAGVPVRGRIYRLNCVINDNDGTGRKCWLELSGGIREDGGSDGFREFMLV